LQGEATQVDAALGGRIATQVLRQGQHAYLLLLAVLIQQDALGVLHLPGTAILGAGAAFVDFDDLDDAGQGHGAALLWPDRTEQQRSTLTRTRGSVQGCHAATTWTEAQESHLP
jgi:hypothetical protein